MKETEDTNIETERYEERERDRERETDRVKRGKIYTEKR